MNTQLPGPKHARADIGRAHRGRALLAAAAASLVALTGFGGVALADDPQSGAQSGVSDVAENSSGFASTPDGESALSSESGVSAPDPEGDSKSGVSSVDTQSRVALAARAQAVSCQAGYVYGVSATGQLQQVDPDGTVESIGSPASRVLSFNGLGIGSDGAPVYAYERSNSARTVTMYSYDATAGSWTSTNDSYDTSLQSNGAYSSGSSLVAGAVDLSDDTYYFGGFQTTENSWQASPRYVQVFKVWKYDPSASPRFSYKGSVPTYSGNQAPGAANGDMAFDAAGNAFIVRGSGTSTTVFSVTAADLAASNGGSINTSDSKSFTTMSNVNGVAFGADGRAYLGAGGEIRSYDMPGWSNSKTVTSSRYSGTDLASCSSPPTVVIEKEIVGGRVNDSDQFTLDLKQGSTDLGTATTQGSASGVQGQRIGPVPTRRNVELSFSESAAEGSTTNLDDYASAYQCTVTYRNGTTTDLGQVSGRQGTVTIPSDGDAVRCLIRNAPLIANVTIHKDLTDVDGNNPVATRGWTVGETADQTTGNVTSTPTDATQTTDSNGDARWALRFDRADAKANVSVSETQQPGYRFAKGTCTVTHLDGSTTGVTLESEAAQSLPDIKPGDDVQCFYTNQEVKTTLTVIKTVSNSHGGAAGVNDFDLTATPESGAVLNFTSGESKTVAAGAYKIGETQLPGYEQTDLSCVAGGEELDVSDSTVQVASAQEVVCTITNADLPGSVTWSKVSEGGDPLNGSTWSLVGPDGTGSKTVSVEDCVEEDPASCTGADRDPAGGSFKVENLSWGDYTLTETKAPAGYVLSTTEHEFQISAESRDYAFADPFVNTQVIPPSLPLTGGLGTDTFLLAGGGLLALAGIGGWIHRRRSQRLRMA